MLLFLIGIFCNAAGAALTARLFLGVAPISTVPLAASIIWPSVSFGMATLLFNVANVLGQFLILRKEFQPHMWLGIAVAIVFGYMIDFAGILVAPIPVEGLGLRWFWFLAASLASGFGTTVALKADFLMLPGDSFVKAVCGLTKIEYGSQRVIYDVCLVVIAAVLSFVCLGEVASIGAGTLVAALLVGNSIKVFKKLLKVPMK